MIDWGVWQFSSQEHKNKDASIGLFQMRASRMNKQNPSGNQSIIITRTVPFGSETNTNKLLESFRKEINERY